MNEPKADANPPPSGRVIVKPAAKHGCSPGWTWRTAERGPLTGELVGSPPRLADYPKGTLWQCDCGQMWLSHGRSGGRRRMGDGYEAPGVAWRREGRYARWRRTRKARRG